MPKPFSSAHQCLNNIKIQCDSAGAKKASQIQKAAVASLERNYFTKAFNAALEVYKACSIESILVIDDSASLISDIGLLLKTKQ